MKRLLEGRKIDVCYPPDRPGDTAVEFTTRVLSLKQFLPAGPVGVGQPSAQNSYREWDLVQVWTENGMRTLALKNITKIHR